MKIFIDSAEIEEIKAAAQTGLVDGITTNPSLVARSGRNFKELLEEITSYIHGPISAEVTENDANSMFEQGKELAKIHENIVIKVPLNTEGLIATQKFSSEGIKTNVTLCFSANQAWLAAKSGATYISPFVGRLDDISSDGMALISDIRTVYDNYQYETQILVASIRHPEHVLQSILIGADVATIPYKVFMQLIKHPLTTAGLETFMKDWNQASPNQ
ncbi:MAG: fructose-6-phosphate aldolase [Bdellovibrionaceae bacterium]|nr:fructose-6-phosphate aldolase [Pseudobdellovibrionaceae bacterium]